VTLLLNIDLGELPGEPEALYALAHLANLACGGHAGEAASLALALERCARHGTRVGAHPSYADRPGFGRTRLQVPPPRLAEQVAEQCALLAGLARERGLAVGHLKPHGALYHAADAEPALAEAVLQGGRAGLGGPFCAVGPEGGELQRAALRLGLAYAREGFADRGLGPGGHLLPRDRPGALLTDPAAAAAQALRLARTGAVETICVHGDTPGAPAIAAAVRAALEAR